MTQRNPQPEALPEAEATRPGTGQAWADCQAAYAAADAARTISTDLRTDAGLKAQLLGVEADASYDAYTDAWFRENYTQAELDQMDAQNQAEAEL